MTDTQTYSPELLPRQGELTAWALSFLCGLGMYILSLRAVIPYWAWFLCIFLIFSALSISLGNWMDRSTRITISAAGLEYQNGLRKVNLAWQDIAEVRKVPARWGTTVQVLGARAHIAFNTLGEMTYQGEVRSRTGFAAGEQILGEIIRAAGLTRTVAEGRFTTYLRA